MNPLSFVIGYHYLWMSYKISVFFDIIWVKLSNQTKHRIAFLSHTHTSMSIHWFCNCSETNNNISDLNMRHILISRNSYSLFVQDIKVIRPSFVKYKNILYLSWLWCLIMIITLRKWRHFIMYFHFFIYGHPL
jgi:hypothetical protein